MVDVVANHMGPVRDFSDVVPFDKPEYYHPYCDIDFNNQTSIENCWLSTLSDLDQRNEFVNDYLKKWIKDLVDTYDIDGFRVDT